MHLSRLGQTEMLSLSQTFLDPNHPANQALVGVPELASLLARLREAHQVLLAHQSQDEVRLSSLQKELRALDAEHDDLIQGIDYLCQAMVLLVEEEEVRKRWERLYQLLLPGGRKMAKLSYQAEADNALLLQQIVDGLPDGDRFFLKQQRVGGRSLFECIERLVATGKDLGVKEQERMSLPIAPTDDALQTARNQWVRIVGAMVAMLQMSELLGELPEGIKKQVLSPLRLATEQSGPHRVARESSGSQNLNPSQSSNQSSNQSPNQS